MFLALIFCIVCVTCNSAFQINPLYEEFVKAYDVYNISVTLKSYNVSNTDGESVELFYTLSPYSQYEIIVTDIPYNVHYVMMQVHSYLQNVTLSQNKKLSYNNSVTGTNLGLIKMNAKSDLSFYVTNNISEKIDILIATQAYGSLAPVPGGCNMEFPVETSPFMQTTYNDAITKVEFALASPSLPVLKNSLLQSSDDCDLKPPLVEYKMYHRYFPERDFTKETYFKMIKSMMTKSKIAENGVYVPEKLTGSLLRRIFASYPGTGNVFVVTCQLMDQTAVYVPSFTSACNDIKEDKTCLILTTTFSKLLCASVLFMGLFACFFGHYFFRIETFFLGFLISSLVTYTLIVVFFNDSMALSIAVATGFFVATTMLFLWIIFGLPIISVILATLSFGFLLASVILYPLVDYINLLVLDINYWSVFIGLVVLCPILMLSFAEKANIAACSFIGSYVAVLSVDHYVGSNLRYIVINTIRRATVPEFRLAIVDPPFQLKDLLLVFAWMLLMFSGIEFQRFLMRNKPPYPPPQNPIKKLLNRLKGPSIRPTEVTPLLLETPSGSLTSVYSGVPTVYT